MLLITLLNFCIFILAIFFVLYLPGFFFLSKVRKDISGSETIALALSLGVVFLVALGTFFGLTNLRYLLLPTLVILGLITLVKFRKTIFSPWSLLIKNKLLLIIIFLGILIQGFISFPSGYQYKDGLLFWSSQGFDGFWHISLMEEIKRDFPPQIPVFSGEKLVNYHYLSDILMGEFARIFPFFSSLDLYFRFFPVLFSFLMGICVFSFVKKWQDQKIALWALFFTYFTGSFGYIVTFLRNGQIFGGETAFWVSQLNTVVANPPHAVAISLLLAFLLSFLILLDSKKKTWFLISFCCAVFIAGFKVSSGVVLLAGVGAAAVIYLIRYKKTLIVYLFILLGISNFITIKMMTRGVEGYLIFSPWWFIRTMVVVKLDWIDLELKRQHYISKGTWHAWLRVLQLELFAFSIFLIGNIGMRAVGFIEIFKKMFLKRYLIYSIPLDICIFVMMLTGFVVPLFFLQKGIAYNTVQFMQYFLLFFGFYAAITTVRLNALIKNRPLKCLFLISIIIFSIPTVIGNFVEFYGPGKTPLAVVTNEELEALQFLKTNSNKDDIVLSPSFNQYLKDRYKSQPFPIYSWYSTGYISGLTGRRTYLALDDMVVQTGFDYEGRRLKVNNFFDQKDILKDRKFLKEEKINYIYIPKVQLEVLLDHKEFMDLVFENQQVLIYKVK